MPDLTPQHPNIVYLHSHDTGRYVQPYGHPFPTPAYQRLADGGIVFRQAFSAAPTCSPSRAALLTGQSPHASGLMGLVHRGFSLNDPGQHLAMTLREVGYRTVMAGTQHTWAGDLADEGYTELRTPHEDSSFDYANAAVAVLVEQSVVGTAPLFLDIGFSDTHRPYPEVRYDDSRYVRAPALLPDTPETRIDAAAFRASVARLDEAVGTVLDVLDETGLAANTLVICTTDHGLPWPGMKCNLTDHGLGVLLIMRGPGGFGGGRVHDALVSHVDIFPTICDLLEIDEPEWLTGRSLLPLARGEVGEVNDAVFGEVTYHAAYEPQRSIRTKRWLFIQRFDGRTRRVLPNIDLSPTRDYLLANGWHDDDVAEFQLYDVLLDPQQLRNLADGPAHGEILVDLRTRLHQWMSETDDPLLDGPVSPPPGGLINSVDGLSPDDPLIGGDSL